MAGLLLGRWLVSKNYIKLLFVNNDKKKTLTGLDENIEENNDEGVGEAGQEPDLHRLDVGGGGEAGGDGQVDRGQDHHAGSDKRGVKRKNGNTG